MVTFLDEIDLKLKLLEQEHRRTVERLEKLEAQIEELKQLRIESAERRLAAIIRGQKLKDPKSNLKPYIKQHKPYPKRLL